MGCIHNRKDYTNPYISVNTYSYSTSGYAKLHNYAMKFSTWMLAQLEELQINVAELARRLQMNQPTVQRIGSGKILNPGFDSVQKIFLEIDSIRATRGLPPAVWIDGDWCACRAEKASGKPELPAPLPANVTTFSQRRSDTNPLIEEILKMLLEMDDKNVGDAFQLIQIISGPSRKPTKAQTNKPA